MAISTSCCVNVCLPTPTHGLDTSPSNSKASQVAWLRDDKWKKQCVLGIACMVIGLQVVGDISDSNAIAKEISIATESSSSVSRWSDKRMCPPWRVNSLETIVPENLPRPSAHRRWEAIGFSKNAAPAVKVTVTRKTRNSCFSM